MFFTIDRWLEEAIGHRALRLSTPNESRDGALPDHTGLRFSEWQSKEEIFFAYAKISPHEIERSWVLSELGFRLVEVNTTFTASRLTLESQQNKEKRVPSFVVRTSTQSDRDAVQRVAEFAFTQSRFHTDPNFDPTVANAIKKAWVSNFFMGQRGDILLVAEERGRVVGFNLLLIDRQKGLVTIDLIAVDPKFQGRGVGHQLILGAIEFGDHMLVGTQISNTKSIKLYQGLGFKLNESKLVFHYHSRSMKEGNKKPCVASPVI